MTALDALHMKVLLRDDLQQAGFRGYLQSFIQTFEGNVDPKEDARAASEIGVMPPVPSPGTFRPGLTGDEFADYLIRMLDVGETFYVDPRMMPLVTAASESMPQEELEMGDMPAEHGFLLIPGGFGMIDVRGRPLKVNAVIWARQGPGVNLYWLNDKNDMEDASNLMMRDKPQWFAKMPRLTVSHVSRMEFGQPLPMAIGPDFVVPPEVKIDVIRRETEHGSEFAWILPEGYSPEELQEKAQFRARTDPMSRWLLTVWRLMQQSITDVSEEHPNRQMRRQMERKNLPEQKVTVIALRHVASRGDGTTEVEWTHRWLVRGYWRRQPYKDENGEWQHRVIFIHPHIRGPEGLPLLIRKHVNALVR